MTAYVALCLKDRIEILTDTALYDEQGIVRGFESKVEKIPGHDVVVVTRGGVVMGEQVKKVVRNVLDEASTFDGAMSTFADFLAGLGDEPETFKSFAAKFEVMIAGLSEDRGPIIFFGSTMPLAGMEAFELHETTVGVSCGAVFHDRVRNQIVERGGLRIAGPALMDALRHKATNSDFSIVGGSIDLTVLRRSSMITEAIHNWGDQAGRKLQLRAPANVHHVALPSAPASMNRQQRRAALKTARGR